MKNEATDSPVAADWCAWPTTTFGDDAERCCQCRMNHRAEGDPQNAPRRGNVFLFEGADYALDSIHWTQSTRLSCIAPAAMERAVFGKFTSTFPRPFLSETL